MLPLALRLRRALWSSALLLCSALPCAYGADTLKICAVPQLYLALEHLHGVLPYDFEARYNTPGTWEEQLSASADTTQECDLLLSSDERLPITLIRAKKGLGSAMLPFTRAPLVLWSADPALFAGQRLSAAPSDAPDRPAGSRHARQFEPCPTLAEVENGSFAAAGAALARDPWDEPPRDPWDEPQRDPWDEPQGDPWDEVQPQSEPSAAPLTQAQRDQRVNAILLRTAQEDPSAELAQTLAQLELKSLAYANAHLTPVGYASRQVRYAAPQVTAHLPHAQYQFEHEYLVYEEVRTGAVQCGLVSKPLVVSSTHSSTVVGSYLTIPRRVHADVQYYVLLMEQSKDKPEAIAVLRSLRESAQVQAILQRYGFAPLAPDEP